MNAATQAIPMAPLYYRNLQACRREVRGSTGRTELLLSDITERGGQGGTRVVERSLDPMEWPKPDSWQFLPHHRDRCLKEGVGGSVQRSLHRGTMEPQRTDHAHQLPRVPSNLSGSAVFCQEQNKCDSPPQDGQHVSTDIHQQTWGNNSPTAEQSSQRDVAVVYGEEHPPQGPAPGRCVEHHRRRRVPSHEGPIRLDAVSRSVPPDQPEAGPSGGRPLCQQTDVSAAGLCQLDTISAGVCHGRIHSQLGRAQSVCQPTMEPDRQSPSTDPPTTDGDNTSDTGVEGTGLVPSDTGNASALSTSDPPEEGPNHSHTPRQLSRSDPPASRVAYLQQRYKDC